MPGPAQGHAGDGEIPLLVHQGATHGLAGGYSRFLRPVKPEQQQGTQVNKERYFYNCGVALGLAGHASQGEWFLRQALNKSPTDRRILYSLIENRLLAGEPAAARDYAARLVAGHSLAAVRADLAVLPTDYAGAPVHADLIAPLILEAARQAMTGLETLAPGVSR